MKAASGSIVWGLFNCYLCGSGFEQKLGWVLDGGLLWDHSPF
jgi:hypothetical protein